MRLIYLDQWVWIKLARAYHGLESNKISNSVLEFVSAAKDSGEARFPLSLAHYYETHKHGDPVSRLKLAATMIKFSELYTLADLDSVVRYEVERALKRRFQESIIEHPFSVLGKGVKHASGYSRELDIIRKPEMSRYKHEEIKAFANSCIEIGALAGFDIFGSDVSRITELPGSRRFTSLISQLPKDAEQIPDFGLEAFLRGRCINDIRPVIEDVLFSAGLTWQDFWSLSALDQVQFVNELPTQRVQKHLMRQIVKNPRLPKRDTDLNDWVYLGLAVSYCDIVLAEKQFADLVNRKGLVKKATVISSVDELPRF